MIRHASLVMNDRWHRATFTLKAMQETLTASGWTSGETNYLMSEKNFLLIGCDFGGDEEVVKRSELIDKRPPGKSFYQYLDITDMSHHGVAAHRRAHKPVCY